MSVESALRQAGWGLDREKRAVLLVAPASHLAGTRARRQDGGATNRG